MTSVPTKRGTVFFKVKSCNELLRTLMVCTSIYLVRIRVLGFNFKLWIPVNRTSCIYGCDNSCLFLEAKMGPRVNTLINLSQFCTLETCHHRTHTLLLLLLLSNFSLLSFGWEIFIYPGM